MYISYKFFKEDQDFNLCGLLIDQLIENIDLKKKTNYPLRFGTMIKCIKIYFLNFPLIDNNVVWKINESFCKQIFSYFTSRQRVVKFMNGSLKFC